MAWPKMSEMLPATPLSLFCNVEWGVFSCALREIACRKGSTHAANRWNEGPPAAAFFTLTDRLPAAFYPRGLWKSEIIAKNLTINSRSNLSIRFFFCACLLALTLARPATSNGALRGEFGGHRIHASSLRLRACRAIQTRIFVAEQGGRIKIVNLATGTVNPTPFPRHFRRGPGRARAPGSLE